MDPRPQSHRRDFLTGRAALRSLAALGGTPPAEAMTDTPPPTFLIEIGRAAMACQFDVLLNAGQYPRAEETALESLDLLEVLEQQMSVYRSHSDISHINRTAAERGVPVEPRLFGLLQTAKELYEETEGAFDITAGPLIRAWGFFRRAGRLPSETEIAAALARVGSDAIELDPTDHHIRFRRHGMELNLGAIGKGYALDRCAERLDAAGIGDYLMHGGQSSILARGSRSSEQGWSVGLRHPLVPERRIGIVRLFDRALGTSGAANQFFYFGQRRLGHVIDPRTGWPAESLLSATVLAPRAALADALSTAFFVMGPDAVRAYCASHPDIGAILVAAGPLHGATVVETIGIDEGAWEPIDDA